MDAPTYTAGDKVCCLYPAVSSLHDDKSTWRWHEANVVERTATASGTRPSRVYLVLLQVPTEQGPRPRPYAATPEMLRPYDRELIGRTPRTTE